MCGMDLNGQIFFLNGSLAVGEYKEMVMSVHEQYCLSEEEVESILLPPRFFDR